MLVRLAVAVSLVACGPHDSAPHLVGSPTSGANDVPARCESLDLFIVPDALRLPHHPCHDWVEATRGRVFATGVAFSGTVVATTAARGGGVFFTCRHCAAEGEQLLKDPETEPPQVLQVREQDGFYFAYRLFGTIPPRSAFDDKGSLTRILPRDDIAVATISNKRYRSTGAFPLASAHVQDGAIQLSDPRAIAASTTPWATARPGEQALLLGYPRNLPDRNFRGELVASVGVILDDASAHDKLARADADEASIPYDGDVELVIAARAVSGMSGGGVFDVDGRFLGVMVRATTQRVDGTYLTRAVRASYIRAQLEAAMAQAEEGLRDRIRRFLPSL